MVTVTLVILNELTIPIESGAHALYSVCHAAAGGRHEPAYHILGHQVGSPMVWARKFCLIARSRCSITPLR